jgi:hypothetical protein
MAGYSGTPLLKKLGIKPGYKMYIYQPPGAYFEWLNPLPEKIVLAEKLSGPLDFIHLFVKNQKDFQKVLLKGKRFLKSDGMLWVSWPKKSSGVVTDLDENVIRDFGLAQGLVDIKVCAVDETWSGLKFVIPVKERK